jgi:hypothetical protein
MFFLLKLAEASPCVNRLGRDSAIFRTGGLYFRPCALSTQSLIGTGFGARA